MSNLFGFNHRSWNSFLYGLKVSRWTRYWAYLFLFISSVSFTFFFTYKQSEHVQTEWKMYSFLPVHELNSDMVLLPEKYYSFKWEQDYEFAWIDVDGFTNYFANYRDICQKCWDNRIGKGNWYWIKVSNPFHVKVSDTTKISIMIMKKGGENIMNLSEIREILIKEGKEGAFMDLDELKKLKNYKK